MFTKTLSALAMILLASGTQQVAFCKIAGTDSYSATKFEGKRDTSNADRFLGISVKAIYARYTGNYLSPIISYYNGRNKLYLGGKIWHSSGSFLGKNAELNGGSPEYYGLTFGYGRLLTKTNSKLPLYLIYDLQIVTGKEYSNLVCQSSSDSRTIYDLAIIEHLVGYEFETFYKRLYFLQSITLGLASSVRYTISNNCYLDNDFHSMFNLNFNFGIGYKFR